LPDKLEKYMSIAKFCVKFKKKNLIRSLIHQEMVAQ